MKAKHEHAVTIQDSDLSRAIQERRCVGTSNTERRFLKRQAHRANRRNARIELRKNYFNQEIYITW